MPFANFEALAESLCELHGVPAPVLTPDEHGTLALSLGISTCTVEVLEFERSRGEWILLMVDLQPVSTPAEWLCLLEAGAFVPADGSFRIARSPLSGAPVALWQCRPAHLGATELYSRVLLIAELGDAPASRIADSLARWPGAPDCAQSISPDATATRVHFGGRECVISRPDPDLQEAKVSIPIAKNVRGDEPSQVASVLEVNYLLALQSTPAQVSMDTTTRELSLDFMYPLANARASGCASLVTELCGVISEWEAAA